MDVKATYLLGFLGVAMLAFASACTGEAEGEPAQPARAQPDSGVVAKSRLQLVRAEGVEHQESWKVRGVLEPARTARAAFILGGRLTKVLVERGDDVEEGQILARLDASEVGAGIAQARAAVAAADSQVRLAEDALQRLERLRSDEAIPEAQVVKIRLQHEGAVALRNQARGALRMAQVKSGQHVLRSPIAGTVLDVPERLGEIVGPGIPQFEIAALDRLRFRGSVPGEAAGEVAVGQEVEVHRRTGETLSARITYVSPALTADTHRLPFEAEMEVGAEQRDGLANSYVRVVVQSSTTSTVARIPSTCLVRGDETRAFVVDSTGIIRSQTVNVVGNRGDRSLVQGVEPGAEVVNLPPVDLTDGTRLER